MGRLIRALAWISVRTISRLSARRRTSIVRFRGVMPAVPGSFANGRASVAPAGQARRPGGAGPIAEVKASGRAGRHEWVTRMRSRGTQRHDAARRSAARGGGRRGGSGCLLWMMLVASALPAGEGLAQSGAHREAAGWLQLESDQRRYRDRAEPLSARDEAGLERLEQRQFRGLRDLQGEQRRERRLEQRSGRMREPAARVRAPFPEPERSREVDRQRLNQRIQREAFGAGRW